MEVWSASPDVVLSERWTVPSCLTQDAVLDSRRLAPPLSLSLSSSQLPVLCSISIYVGAFHLHCSTVTHVNYKSHNALGVVKEEVSAGDVMSQLTSGPQQEDLPPIGPSRPGPS